MKYKTERQNQKNFLLKEGDYKSTKEIFERIAKYLPNAPIFAELDENKNIVYHNATQVLEDVENLGDGLIDLGLEGKHIAISAENSYLYVIADASICGGVGVVTPIDKDAPEQLLVTLLQKCDADAIICSSAILEKVQNAQKQCPALKTIITIDQKIQNVPYIQEIMQVGKDLASKQYYHNKQLDLNAPAKILFTSGTTGANKGVVLTQNNLSANIINCIDTLKADDKNNTSMSVLPMHHATEINTHIMSRVSVGRLTYINDSMKNLMINIKIFKPYNITIVPMIANAFYKNIWSNARKAGKEAKLKKGIKLCKFFKLFGIDLTHKLFKDIFDNFGGNLNQIVCGGAMLNPEVVKGMSDLGVYIINGYGITECGPLVSMNSETLQDCYSVGITPPGLQAHLDNIDEEGVGELCVKGKSVALGYYKDDEATKQVFYQDGTFNTGDLARIDEKGRIFLVGRKKNAIVLENGKNISPEEIEHEIQIALDYAKDVVVYLAPCQTQSGLKNVLCVGLYIEDEQIKNDKDKIKADIEKVNQQLPNYKRIDYINLVNEEYEKTSTRKIKRTTILDKHDSKSGIKL